MDNIQVLQSLYPAESPIQWGPAAQSDTPYADFIIGWAKVRQDSPPSQALMLSTWNTIVANAPTVAEAANQVAATTAFADKTPVSRIQRAVAVVIMNEFNLVRQRLRAQDAAIAAATSLADLKTRWAALAAVPDRTLSQVKTAITNAINSTDSD